MAPTTDPLEDIVPGSLARRYAPFLILAAVQVLLVALVPSTGGPAAPPEALTVMGGGTGGDLGNAGAGGPAAEGGTASTGGEVVGAGTGAPGTPSASGTGAGASTTSRGGVTAATSADRSKCAPGGVRQQDVTITSPPCVPRFSGDNGGATYQGVSREAVTVLRYRAKSNAQVDAILRTQGLASTPEEEQQAQDAFAAFFEKHYEFHGRKINWVTVFGNCEISPPDAKCFRDEVKALNAKHRPFAVFWTASTVQYEFFEQWSQLGVVNAGGWHFNADFNTANRPYHWDVFMDGTRTARTVAEYWCKRMQGKPASLAGDPTMRTKRRKMGIITQDFPVTKKNALDLQRMVSGGMCGAPEEVSDPFYTPSNITQSQNTMSAAVQKLKSEGVTTLVIMSDPIGPTFTTTAASEQQWYPEHLLAGSGLIDYDVLARLYDQSQWVNAFGPGHLADPIPFAQTDAAKAAADVGAPAPYSGANLLYAYMSLVASGVQMAGPKLTPAAFEHGLLTVPPGGGWERTKNPASVLVKFGPGDYTAIEDARHTYWSPNTISKIDNKPGAYLAVENGRRWEIGTWTKGEPKQP